MMNIELNKRLGFLVKDVARLYSWHFDRLARERLGLSLAQCRLLGAIALHQGDAPPSQAALAEKLDLTPMGVTKLCDRMQAAKWIVRKPHVTDRRTNQIVLLPRARKALQEALALGDQLQAAALKGLTSVERQAFLDALRHAHANLTSLTI
jgi:DNA-binding MarR family transcriptional regulator